MGASEAGKDPSGLHSMKCKWGTITKHVVVVSLVSLSASVSGPRVGGGRHWRKPSPLDGSIPLPSDTVLEWEGSGLWDPIPVSQEPVSHSAAAALVGNSLSELPREKHLKAYWESG